MTDAVPPEQRRVPPPPRLSNRRAVVALICGGVAFLAASNNSPHPLPASADLTFAFSYYSFPLLLSGIAIAAGYSGVVRARSAARGAIPAGIGFGLGLVDLFIYALRLINLIQIVT